MHELVHRMRKALPFEPILSFSHDFLHHSYSNYWSTIVNKAQGQHERQSRAFKPLPLPPPCITSALQAGSGEEKKRRSQTRTIMLIPLDDHFIVTRRHQCTANTTFDSDCQNHIDENPIIKPAVPTPSFPELELTWTHTGPVCFTRHSEVCNRPICIYISARRTVSLRLLSAPPRQFDRYTRPRFSKSSLPLPPPRWKL